MAEVPLRLCAPQIKEETADVVIIYDRPDQKAYIGGVDPNIALVEKVISQFKSDKKVVFLPMISCSVAGNGDAPLEASIACRPFVRRELERLNPERVILLGKDVQIALGGAKQPENQWFQMNGDSWNYINVLGARLVHSKPTNFVTFFRALQKAITSSLTWEEPPKEIIPKTVEELLDLLSSHLGKALSLDIETANGIDTYNNFVLSGHIYGKDFAAPISFDGLFFFNYKFREFLSTADILWCGANIQNFDAKVLFHIHDINLPKVCDLAYLDYIIDESVTGTDGIKLRNLGFLSTLLINAPDYKDAMKPYIKDMGKCPKDLLMKYGGMDAYCSFKCYEVLRNSLDERQENLLTKTIIPNATTLRNMSSDGVYIDVPYLDDLDKRFEEELKGMTAVFEGRNPGSPKQMSEWLFKELKYVIPSGCDASTNEKNLAQVLRANEGRTELTALLDWRKISKLRTQYTTGLADITTEDGYIHTDYNITGTNTGRPASRNPNLQNIPARTEIGRAIKRAFIVPPNEKFKLFFNIDYAQLEARLIAIASNDKLLIDLINSGADMHRYGASIWFGVPESEITKEQRNWFKTGLFGVIYGLTERGAGYQLGLANSDGARFVRTLKKEIFSGLGNYIDTMHSFALANNYVPYMDSYRIRHFHLINDWNLQDVLKHSINSPIQGRGSDFNIDAARMAREQGHNGVRLTVHDALGGYVYSLDEAHEIAEIMTVTDYAVHLTVEVSYGLNWRDLEVSNR